MALRCVDGGRPTLNRAAPCPEPECKRAGCRHCDWIGTHAAWEANKDRWAFRDQVVGIPDSQLSEIALTHAVQHLRQFRSPTSRYVLHLLEEVCRRAGLEVE